MSMSSSTAAAATTTKTTTQGRLSADHFVDKFLKFCLCAGHALPAALDPHRIRVRRNVYLHTVLRLDPVYCNSNAPASAAFQPLPTALYSANQPMADIRHRSPPPSPTISIFFPDYTRKSDVITLRGPCSDVDKCHSYLQKPCHDLVRLALSVTEIYGFICDLFVYYISKRCIGLYAEAK